MHRALLALLVVVPLSAGQAFLVRFGVDDDAARDWSGSVRVEGGRLISAAGWQLDEGDSVSGSDWTLNTQQDEYWHSPWERSLFGTKRLTKLSERGVLLRVEMTGSGKISIETEQGPLSFLPEEVGWGEAQAFGGGRAVVERAPAPERFDPGGGAAGGSEDYVSAMRSADGTSWTAWQSYRDRSDRSDRRDRRDRRDSGDRLWVRRDGGEPEALTTDGRDLYGVELAEASGAVWAVWAEKRDGDWDLFARPRSGDAWGEEQRLTEAEGTDFHHALASDGEKLYLVWQSFRDGQGEIYLKIHDGEAWGAAKRVSNEPANDWEPHVAARAGQAAVVWDTYADGDYDLRLRLIEDGRLGDPVTLVDTASFEARPRAHYDASGRLWLAWEEGDPQWGKDYVNGAYDAGMGLLMKRQSRVAVYEGGRLRQPAGDLAEALPEQFRDVFLAPRLLTDAAGRPWVFFRYRTNTPRRTKPAYRSMWRTGASVWSDGGWSPLIRFADGYGRIDAPVAVHPTDDGMRVWWVSDGREFPAGFPQEQNLYSADITIDKAPEALELTDLRLPTEDFPAVHVNEVADVARMRAYRAEVDGTSYRIVRGDMHRHTDVSWDGNRDGSMLDAYRYALDAAGMDYLGVADHTYGEGNEYYWWFTQKIADLMTIPGRFAPLQGYERSRSYPSGHRNVMFAQRGEKWFEFSEAERKDNKNTGLLPLYAHLREKKGIVMVHTSATGAGSDWSDNDPEVEPLMEIYQGYRKSYEHRGAPRSSTVGDRAAGYVWKAWEKGLKIGLQSSSDHVSTHASYGMIWVDDVNAEAVIAGIRARRAYAATDNILVDFRVNGAWMGAAIEGSGKPKLEARIVGTGPIRKVEVIRNNEYIHTQPGGAAEMRFSFVDNEPPPGESWYYIRVEQEDGELAWASPVWVTRR